MLSKFADIVVGNSNEIYFYYDNLHNNCNLIYHGKNIYSYKAYNIKRYSRYINNMEFGIQLRKY